MLLLLLLLIMFFLPSFFFDEIIKVYYNCMFSYRVCHFFSFCTKKKNWKLYSCWCLLFIFTAVNFVLRLLIYYAVNGQFFFCCFMTTICDFLSLYFLFLLWVCEYKFCGMKLNVCHALCYKKIVYGWKSFWRKLDNKHDSKKMTIIEKNLAKNKYFC